MDEKERRISETGLAISLYTAMIKRNPWRADIETIKKHLDKLKKELKELNEES